MMVRVRMITMMIMVIMMIMTMLMIMIMRTKEFCELQAPNASGQVPAGHSAHCCIQCYGFNVVLRHTVAAAGLEGLFSKTCHTQGAPYGRPAPAAATP